MQKRIAIGLVALIVVAVLAVACASAPPAAQQPAAPPAAQQQPAQQPAAPQQPAQKPAEQKAAASLPFGLKPGKPYNGTKLKYLVCCPTAQQFYSLNQKTAEFTELTGITVEWGQTPFAAFQEELLKEGASGGGNYDLMAWVDAWGPALQQYIAPLDARIKADNFDIKDYPDAYINPGKAKDGSVFGLPLRGHAFMLFYRKDVFDKLGLKTPETWADIENAAKVIQEKTNLKGISPYYGINGGQNLFIWESMIWSNGGDLFDKDWKPIFNNEAGLQATQRYIDWLLTKKITPEGSKTFNEQEGLNEIVQGRAAMFLGWSWMYANLNNKQLAAPEVYGNIAFIPAPAWEGKGKPATYGYIWLTGIAKGSKNQDAAWEYLKWMTHSDTEKKVALDKSDPKLDNVVVVRYSTMRDPEVNAKHNNLQKTMADVLQNARNQPLMPEWLQVQSILEIAINKMAAGAPVKETLDKAAADVTDLLKRNGYYK